MAPGGKETRKDRQEEEARQALLAKEAALNEEAYPHLPDEAPEPEEAMTQSGEQEKEVEQAAFEHEVGAATARHEQRAARTVFDTQRQTEELREDVDANRSDSSENGDRFADSTARITDTTSAKIDEVADKLDEKAEKVATKMEKMAAKYSDEKRYGELGEKMKEASQRATRVSEALKEVQEVKEEPVEEGAEWWEKALSKVMQLFEKASVLWAGWFGGSDGDEEAENKDDSESGEEPAPRALASSSDIQAEIPDDIPEAPVQAIDGMTINPAFGIDGPTTLTSIFGNRYLFEHTRLHNGFDLSAALGTPIKAKQTLTVVSAIPAHKNKDGKEYSAGNAIIVRDPDGNYHTLCHTQNKPKWKKGDVIEPGEEIARVGSTGRSTGPHLHWNFSTKGPSLQDNEDPTLAVNNDTLLSHVKFKRKAQQDSVDEHAHDDAPSANA